MERRGKRAEVIFFKSVTSDAFSMKQSMYLQSGRYYVNNDVIILFWCRPLPSNALIRSLLTDYSDHFLFLINCIN